MMVRDRIVIEASPYFHFAALWLQRSIADNFWFRVKYVAFRMYVIFRIGIPELHQVHLFNAVAFNYFLLRLATGKYSYGYKYKV